MSPVNANTGEYKSKIGLDSLYIAEVTVDSAAAYTADTPEYLAPAAEASQQPATNSQTQYADDQAYDVIDSEGETAINLSVTGIPPEMQAKLLGRVFDAASGRVFDNPGATAPYFALSFRALKSNGSYRYYQYLKGKFDNPQEDTTTRGETPDPKVMSLVYRAIKTIHVFDLGDIDDSAKRVFGDEDTDNFDGATWFSQVQTPVVVAPSALSLSSSTPTDGATGISVSANQTLTFNNALTAGAVNNVVLVKADGTVIAGAITLDATKKIVTINPTASLDASSVYIITYGVTDIYGQTLAGAINFTTA
jgi:phi13 family phage major tail protein